MFRQTFTSKCTNGLAHLQNLGLTPTIENLDIALFDPFSLSSDLCKIQNRYALQGECKAIRQGGGGLFQALFQNNQNNQNNQPTFVFPTLYIDGKDMGTLDSLKVQAIRSLAEPSPFGLGTKTVYDESVRKATEIRGNRINLDLNLTTEVRGLAPMGYRIIPKLYKLAIYEKDGFFAEHADTLHGENHIGTLVVCLPVPHEGGAFILSDEGNELVLPFDDMIKDNKIPWVAFYTDVKHKVEVVKSGVRMTIQYDLMIEKVDFDEDASLMNRLEGLYHKVAPRYRFHEYNEEIMVSIRDKLNKIFPVNQEDSKKLVEEVKMNEEQKKESDDVKEEPSKQHVELPVKEQEEEKDEDEGEGGEEEMEEEDEESEEEYEQENGKNLSEKLAKRYSHPDGIAIMLKRRYGAPTLSLDKLKGTDSALYYALKDHFRVEVKQIILEQSSDYEGRFNNQQIEVVAIAELNKKQESCSSEEELEIDEANKKHIPKLTRPPRNNRYYAHTHANFKCDGKAKKVCLVSGLSPQAISLLVERNYAEATGNDAQEAMNSYIHAALFIYPKSEKEIEIKK